MILNEELFEEIDESLKANITNVQDLYEYAVEQGLKKQAIEILRDNSISVNNNDECEENSANSTSHKAFIELKRLVDGIDESLNREKLKEWSTEAPDGAEYARLLSLSKKPSWCIMKDGERFSSPHYSLEDAELSMRKYEKKYPNSEFSVVPNKNQIKEDLEGPSTPAENGVAKLLLQAINDESDTIQYYNDLIANTDNADIIAIVQDITEEENNHIGMLQKALEVISPNAAAIEGGQKEAEEKIAEVADDEIDVIPEIDSVDEDYNGFPDFEGMISYALETNGIDDYQIDEDIISFNSHIEALAAQKVLEEHGLTVNEYADDAIAVEELNESLKEDLHDKFKKDIKNDYKAWAAKQEKVEQNRKEMLSMLDEHPEVSEETRDSWIEKVNNLYPNQEFEYDFPHNIEKIDYPFYVTYYAEYPIYEPAEGGYYYAGNDAIWSEGFNTEEEAWDYLNKYIEQDDEWHEWEKYSDGYTLNGKYIGQNQYAVIEPRKSYLSRVKGWEPYQ